MTERELQQGLIDAAKLAGWLVYHTHDSRRSEPGFPDLVLVHPRRRDLAFIECKSERGRLTHEQQVWLRALMDFAATYGGPVRVGVANPQSYDEWLAYIVKAGAA